ncbi:chloroplast inner envelope family protein [Salix suchowensis]|nr:chloroplast inner envelope family protein [Salix suchowensis]
MKSRTRTVQDVVKVVEELDKILAFDNKLISLKNHEDAASFACGDGPVSVSGGKYDSEREKDDLKLLYRAYVTDALSGGRMEEHKLAALNQLKNIFGLGKREAESITLDITSKVYRKRLAQAVSSGDLEFSDSKAAFLQNLCEELHFDPQKATEIHEEIYRQKLQQCAADGVLSDEDVKALTRLRVMLCIPQHTIDAAHSDICGSYLKRCNCIRVDGYDADVKKAVRKAAHGLRLTRESAMSIAGKAVSIHFDYPACIVNSEHNLKLNTFPFAQKLFLVAGSKDFLNFVRQARMAENRTEGAKALRKLIAFNSLVVTELVADIKGESSDTPPEEPSKVEDKKIEEED